MSQALWAVMLVAHHAPHSHMNSCGREETRQIMHKTDQIVFLCPTFPDCVFLSATSLQTFLGLLLEEQLSALLARVIWAGHGVADGAIRGKDLVVVATLAHRGGQRRAEQGEGCSSNMPSPALTDAQERSASLSVMIAIDHLQCTSQHSYREDT